MRISDSVANYILALLEEDDGCTEIQRNESGRNSGVCAQSDQLCSDFSVYSGERLPGGKPAEAAGDISALPGFKWIGRLV